MQTRKETGLQIPDCRSKIGDCKRETGLEIPDWRPTMADKDRTADAGFQSVAEKSSDANTGL